MRATLVGDDGLYQWVSCLPCDALIGDVWSYYDQPEEGVTGDDYAGWACEHAGDPRAQAFLARIRNAA